jgi:hypothetical protein
MKKILLIGLIFISINLKAQILGITSGSNFSSKNYNYGLWYDNGKYGVEIERGLITNRPESLTPLMNYENIVVYKDLELNYFILQYGLGITLCDQFNFRLGRHTHEPYPMYMIGITKDLGYYSRYVFKTNLLLSCAPTLNIGIGMKL